MASMRTPEDHGASIFNGAMGMNGQPMTATLTPQGMRFSTPRPIPGRFPSVPGMDEPATVVNSNVQYG